MIGILIATGGFFGALARYGVSQWISKRNSSTFPYGTLFVNLSGSFLLGLVAGSKQPASVQALVAYGFLGAFTTFSTFKLENVQLGVRKEWNTSLTYLAVSYSIGILLGFFGYKIGLIMKG